MIATWERAWDEFVPFLAFPVELRQIVYTTNAIESLNARFRKAVRHRGHFPDRAVGVEGALPRRHRETTEPVQPDRPDQRLEDHPQRPDHPLRRPHRGRQLTMTITTAYTDDRTVPALHVDGPVRGRDCDLGGRAFVAALVRSSPASTAPSSACCG